MATFQASPAKITLIGPISVTPVFASTLSRESMLVLEVLKPALKLQVPPALEKNENLYLNNRIHT